MSIFAQKAVVKGYIRDTKRNPIEGVNITFANSAGGATSNSKGEYFISIPAKTEIILEFSHVSYNTFYKRVKIPKNKTYRFSPLLTLKTEEINEVTIQDKRKAVQGFTTVKKEKVKKLPGANPGVENLLMTFAGVSNNNELRFF